MIRRTTTVLGFGGWCLLGVAVLLLLPGCLENSYRERHCRGKIKAGPTGTQAIVITAEMWQQAGGSGPTGKLVRIRNGTSRHLRPGTRGYGSGSLNGDPKHDESEFGDYPGINSGNTPGGLGSGSSTDPGYMRVEYKPGLLHPSLWMTNVSLARILGTTTPKTNLAPFAVTIESPTGYMHITEVLITLEEQPSGSGGTEYFATWDLHYVMWDSVAGGWVMDGSDMQIFESSGESGILGSIP